LGLCECVCGLFWIDTHDEPLLSFLQVSGEAVVVVVERVAFVGNEGVPDIDVVVEVVVVVVVVVVHYEKDQKEDVEVVVVG